jgi:hypothetical protein
MKNKPIPPVVATALIAIAVCVTAACELNALQAKERREHPDGAQTRAECLRCHSGPKWIAKIAEKEGKKPTDPLFVDDPSPKAGSVPAGAKCPASGAYGGGATTYKGK